jgi:RimJ/RimL family protein N-acetyltransferase
MTDRTSLLNAGPLDLTDGGRVCFRPIRPDDTARLRAFHRRLSLDSQRMRFFTALRELSPSMAESFCNVDFDRRVAVVVCYPGEEVIRGVGRYEIGDDRKSAEVAFVVEDHLQGKGVGKALLRLLAVHARGAGVDQFTAVVLPENSAMLGVFQSCEFPTTVTHSDGTNHVTLDIGEPHEPLPLPAFAVE